MGELRKDYLLERYVIIATERGKRPDEFKHEKVVEKEAIDFFDPGHENLTPPEIERYPPDAKEWDIRVFPNKFPAVKLEGKHDLVTDNEFFTYSDAYGEQEVIVETPNRKKTLADLSEKKIVDVLHMFQKRMKANLARPNVKYVSLFKNHGKGAGTSVKHTHCQLIAYNIIPQIIKEKEAAVKAFGSDPYEKIIAIEKESDRRCFENEHIVSFAPYASRFPFEVWVFPKRHVLNITDLNEDEITSLAEVMKKILKKLQSLNADYNFFLQYGLENMRFHIEFTPRLATWAGFELGTETTINAMPPEKAAEFYREE